jgi:hypothetical protein
MKHTARFAKLTLTLILLAILAVTNALAQEEKGIIISNIPVGLVSPNNLTITYIPLADIGTALGSAVKYDAGRNRYTVQPSEGGILKLNPEHAGIIISNRPAPEAEGQRVSPTARVMRRPQQPAEQPAVPEATSFVIGDQLVSKGIIIINNRPYMPLDDLAAAMGTIVEDRPSPEGGGTVRALVPQQGATPLLGLSERGIIIIDNMEQ